MKQLETTSHIVHFILMLCTGGLWAVVWLLAALMTNKANITIKEHNQWILNNQAIASEKERRDYELRQLELMAIIAKTNNKENEK